MNLWELLGLKGRGDAGREDTSSETVRAVVQRLERLEPDQARRIASFAYILGRVAHVDLEISREETTAMEQAVRTLGGLTEAEAVVVGPLRPEVRHPPAAELRHPVEQDASL